MEKAFSVFQKACNKLGIEIIKAYSPQAKGRVERSHKVYQDRLVKEIWLQKLSSIEEVNSLLQNGFIADLNKRFAKAPTDHKDAHRPSPDAASLDNILVWDATRIVQKDYTIRYQNQCYQITPTSCMIVKAGSTITVRQHLNNRLTLWFKDRQLSFTCVDPNKPEPVININKGLLAATQKSSVGRRNSANSPWRNFNLNGLKHKPSVQALQQTLAPSNAP